MKKRSILIFFLILTFNLSAFEMQQNQSVEAYRQALQFYDQTDYGNALKYAEDAVLYRRQYIENQTEELKKSLSSKQVQKAGKDINQIKAVLEERQEFKSINIIDSYLKIKGNDFFHNSINELLDYMNKMIVFPEAHKLIGDVYKVEGEYDFAEEYYQLALKNCDVLDIPDEKYDILYTLAEISRLRNNLPQMETRLLNILVSDTYYMDTGLNNALMNTVKSDKKDSMEKFFNLYRAYSYLSIEAYNQLAAYYYDYGQKEKALGFAALSSITSFSKINDILSSRNPDYQYKNLSTFFQEVSFYDDIIEWGNKTKAWVGFNILAKYTKEMGYKNFSRSLLRVLVQFSPESYWQKDAVLLLETLD